jgi:hypothetical protein
MLLAPVVAGPPFSVVSHVRMRVGSQEWVDLVIHEGGIAGARAVRLRDGAFNRGRTGWLAGLTGVWQAQGYRWRWTDDGWPAELVEEGA